ncbi:MAG TPA: OsmC family protein [Gemmatimonadaceae bacterium]|nr:OsmC family protein [Gemmatimonadaceae bacterium]
MTAPLLIREYDVSARSTDIFGRVLCSARDHHFIVDGPVQNGCPGEELTPPEAFLTGVAACGVELVHVIAKEQGKSIGSVRLHVHGMLDRGKQSRTDVTVLNSLRLDFVVTGTDAATAAQLVEGFKRR